MSRKEDLAKIEAMIEEVASAMFLKMETKYDEGQEGYDDPEMLENLMSGFKEHRQKFCNDPDDPENIIDMMNFLAMIRRQFLVKRDKLPDRIELVSDPSEIHDFDEKEKKRIEEETDNEETRSVPAIVDMDRPEEEVEEALKEAGLKDDDTKEIVSPKEEEALADAGLKNPRRVTTDDPVVREILRPTEKAEKAMEDAGMRGSEAGMKFRYSQDKKSFDITPLAKDGEKGRIFCLKNYVYIDPINEGIHHIRIAKVDFGGFWYQILSIDKNEEDFRVYNGSEEELFAKIKNEVISFARSINEHNERS